MKKTIVLLMTCWAVTNMVFAIPNGPFLPVNSIDEGLNLAAKTNKLLFVHFTAEWCMPCRWMTESTFSDPELQQWMAVRFLSIQIDIDQTAGRKDQQQYGVTSLPTLLVLTPSGDLLRQLEGTFNPEELLEELTDLKPASAIAPPNMAVAVSVSGPTAPPQAEFSHLNRPPLIPKGSKTTEQQPISVPQPVTTGTFGIEIGATHQYSELIRSVQQLEPRLQEKIFILVEQEQQLRTYRMLVGRYQDRQLAEVRLSQLKQLQIAGKIRLLE